MRVMLHDAVDVTVNNVHVYTIAHIVTTCYCCFLNSSCLQAYGGVRLSICPSVRLSVCPSVIAAAG